MECQGLNVLDLKVTSTLYLGKLPLNHLLGKLFWEIFSRHRTGKSKIWQNRSWILRWLDCALSFVWCARLGSTIAPWRRFASWRSVRRITEKKWKAWFFEGHKYTKNGGNSWRPLHPNEFVCGMLSWAATRNSPLEQWIHFSSNRQLGCSSNKKRLMAPGPNLICKRFMSLICNSHPVTLDLETMISRKFGGLVIYI